MLPCAATDSAPARTPVVVELFTSQACSSCPPADRLLTEIGSRDDIIALAFHVDYWNHLGWQDPFSSSEWSQRQQRYAETLFRGRVYTPQIVVNGRTHLVGSRRHEVEATIALARSEPIHDHIAIGLTADRELGFTTALETRLEGDLLLQLAIVENGRDTAVPSGENARRKLHNDHIVRALHTVAIIPATPGRATHTYRLPTRWTRPGTQLVAYLQHPTSMHILAAAKLTLTD